jgi:hypothetical protein
MNRKWIGIGLMAALALPAYAQERKKNGSKTPGRPCRKNPERAGYRRTFWIRLTAWSCCHPSRNLLLESVAVTGGV